MKCLRCDVEMEFAGQEDLQLGQASMFLRSIPNVLAGALAVDIHICPKCGKIEFFKTHIDLDEINEDGIPQKNCPRCGKKHDFDYPKCPYCKYKYDI